MGRECDVAVGNPGEGGLKCFDCTFLLSVYNLQLGGCLSKRENPSTVCSYAPIVLQANNAGTSNLNDLVWFLIMTPSYSFVGPAKAAAAREIVPLWRLTEAHIFS